MHTHITNTRIGDVEILERRYPVMIHRFGIREGSGGRGKFNGGDGVVREIEFLEPVDLTGLQRTTELLGEIVQFDDKECCVYPNHDDAEKPPPGSGINGPARITLVKCWALDKATREPIKDESHPGAVRHLKRLKNMKGTHFESFDIAEGKWVFTVDHF